MRSKPISLSLNSTPTKQADIEAIGVKVSIHCKRSSPATLFIWLTEQNPDGGADANAYTLEIEPGAVYETPMEHVGEVWLASSSGGANAEITITKYG